jgi:hypothetical protein
MNLQSTLEQKAGKKLFLFQLLGGRKMFEFSKAAALLLQKTKVSI